MSKNYYEILEVSEKASIETIKAAYRSLAKRYHSDNGNENHEQMALINEAYDVLSDETKRAEYDSMLNRGENSRDNYRDNQGNDCKEDIEIKINLFGQNISFSGDEMWRYIIQAVFDGSVIEPVVNKLRKQFENNMSLKIFENELQEEPLKNMNNFIYSIKSDVAKALSRIGQFFSIEEEMLKIERELQWGKLEDGYRSILDDAKEAMVKIYNTYGVASTDVRKDQDRLDYEKRMSSGILSSLYMSVTDAIADEIKSNRKRPADKEREAMIEEAVEIFRKFFRDFLTYPKMLLYTYLTKCEGNVADEINEVNRLCEMSNEIIEQGNSDDKGMLARAFRYYPLNISFYGIMLWKHFESCYQICDFIKQCKLQKYTSLGVLNCAYAPSKSYKDINKNAHNIYNCNFIKAVDLTIVEKITLLVGTTDAKNISDDMVERALHRLDEYSRKFGKPERYFVKDLGFLYEAQSYANKRKVISEEIEVIKANPKSVAETQEYINNVKANNEPHIYESMEWMFKELLINSISAELDSDYEKLKSKEVKEIINFVDEMKEKYDADVFEKCSKRFNELIENKVADEVKIRYEELDTSDVEGLKSLLRVVQGEYSRYKCATEYEYKIKSDIIDAQQKLIEAEIGQLTDKSVDGILDYINNAQMRYIAEVYNKYVDKINQIIEDKIDAELKISYDAVDKDDVTALEELKEKITKEYKAYKSSDKYAMALKKDIRVAKEKQLELDVKELKSKDSKSIKVAIEEIKKKYDSELYDKQSDRCKQILTNQVEKELNALYDEVKKTDIEAMKALKELVNAEYAEFESINVYVEKLTNDIYAEHRRLIYEELGNCMNSSMDTNLAIELTRKVEQTECEEIVKKQIFEEIKNQLIDNNIASINDISSKIKSIYPFTNSEMSKFIFFKKVGEVNEAEMLKGIEKIVVKLAMSGIILEQPILSHLREGLLDLPSQLTGFSITQKSLLYYEKGMVNRISLADICDFVIQKKLMSTDIFVTTFSGMSIKLATKFPKEILNNVPIVLKETVKMVKESNIYAE